MSKEYPVPRGIRNPSTLYSPDYSTQRLDIVPIKWPVIDLVAGESPFDPPESYRRIFEDEKKRRAFERTGLHYAELEMGKAESHVRERFGLVEGKSTIVFNGTGSAGIIRQSLDLLPPPPAQSYVLALAPCFPYILNAAISRRDERETRFRSQEDATRESNILRLHPRWQVYDANVLEKKADALGMNIATVNLPLGSSMEETMEETLKLRRDKSFKGPVMIYLCDFNTPDGSTVDPKVRDDFVRKCAENGDFVFIDEAYGDWNDDKDSAMKLTEEVPNLIVSRTFSKALKLPGLRIGYAAMSNYLGERYKASLGFDPYYMPPPLQYIANEVLDPKILNPYLDDVREKTERIKRRFVEQVGNLPKITSLPTSEKSPIFTVKLNTGYFTEDFYNDLYRYGVQAAPGSGFSASDEELNNSYVRLMIPNNERRIREIVRRIRGATL